MSKVTETHMTVELELSVRGTFQPGYAPTYMEPGQSDMVEDPEVCDVIVSKRVPGKYRDQTLSNGTVIQLPLYRDVSLFAKLSDVAKAEVHAALIDILGDEIADQLICDYEPEERDWEAA